VNVIKSWSSPCVESAVTLVNNYIFIFIKLKRYFFITYLQAKYIIISSRAKYFKEATKINWYANKWIKLNVDVI